jgi:2-polyprenyl-3-methyl-5-hydroxy-6-metoxy-1,4-benzoquinol methylase
MNSRTMQRDCQCCDVCGSGRLRDHLRVYDGVRILICRQCRNRLLARWNGSGRGDEFEGIPLDAYVRSVGTQRRAAARTVLDLIERRGGLGRGRLLDIGCSFGWMMDEARKRGWETYGVEPSHIACKYAWEADLEVKNGLFPEVTYEGKRFDVVCLMDVLEHMEEPGRILERVRGILEPRGLVVLSVPSSDGLIVTGSEWLARIAPWLAKRSIYRLYQLDFRFPHLNYLNPRNLRLLLSRQNFETIFMQPMPVFEGDLRARLAYGEDRAPSHLAVGMLWIILKLSGLMGRHDMVLAIAQSREVSRQ